MQVDEYRRDAWVGEETRVGFPSRVFFPAVHGEKIITKCAQNAMLQLRTLWDTSVSTPETVSMASHMVANAGDEIAVACGVQRKAAAGRRVEHNAALTVV